MGTHPPARIFISSTASDLEKHRAAARDAILRLDAVPVAMETFVAGPGFPVRESCARAAEADATVVLVAHRYGYVPSRDCGGDDERSITWLEVEAACAAGKPVFAFLVDPRAPWSQPREQDRLLEERGREAEIAARVQALQDFRAYLQARFVCDVFSGVGDLTGRLTAALARHFREAQTGSGGIRRDWLPLIMHPLQPAPHFHGRSTLREELVRWVRTPTTPDRVISLVAVGGTGKTALIQQVLSDLDGHLPAGLLVWSFYEDHKTDEFLRVACDYFVGGASAPPAERLERLQRALSAGEPHLLVIDGLERVQSDGHDGFPRGSLLDPQLKRLVRFIASGSGRARALITSRFPVVDLADWTASTPRPEPSAPVPGDRSGAPVPRYAQRVRVTTPAIGHRMERLDDLEPAAARGVLRAWGVWGDDEGLDALTEPLHRHALAVAVLGSYLGHFHEGDPAWAPDFDRRVASEADPRAAKLARILDEYARALHPRERDMLARLAIFPRGVKLSGLEHLVQAGGRVAGALEGADEARLSELLRRLRELGLVFAHGAGRDATYTAHPFLRDFFKSLDGLIAEEVHEALRARLAPTLSARPEHLPRTPAELDRYELYVEHTLLAGRAAEAFELYSRGLGGYPHLGVVLGDHARGWRILRSFSPDGTVEGAAERLPTLERSSFAFAWGAHARALGEIAPARCAMRYGVVQEQRLGNVVGTISALYNLAQLEVLAGCLAAARDAAEQALASAEEVGEIWPRSHLHALVASILGAAGDRVGARKNFAIAGELGTTGSDTAARLLEAEFCFRAGDTQKAQELARESVAIAREQMHRFSIARSQVMLGRTVLPGDPACARACLDEARAYTARAWDAELQVRVQGLASELARVLGDLDDALAQARAGIFAADTSGFAHLSVELRLSLARAGLHARDGRLAGDAADTALRLAAGDDVPHVWNWADAYHLAGCAHALSGDADAARERLSSALVIRHLLQHPALEETRSALLELD